MSQLKKHVDSASEKGANPFGITNDEGRLCTTDYVRRYVHCWCRLADGFTDTERFTRKDNIAYFMSSKFLSRFKGKTASFVGHEAHLSDRWDTNTHHPRRNKTNKEEWQKRHGKKDLSVNKPAKAETK